MSNRIFSFFLVAIFLCIIGCGGKKDTPLVSTTEETEPNDSRETAQTVSHGTVVKGYINKKMDVDWYKITMPDDTSAILKAELTGIPNMDIKMELFDADDELLDVDHNKDGAGEVLTNYFLEPGTVYLRVREFWLKDKEKKFNDTLAYHLHIYFQEVTPGMELEINNRAIKATNLIPETSVTAYLSPRGDVDWYKLSLLQQVEKYLELEISGLENVDLKLSVYDPIEAMIYEANEGGKGEGEKIINLGIDEMKEFYYIVVDGGKNQTNEDTTYQLIARFIEKKHKMELEPNDRIVKATEIASGDSIFGFIDRGADVDWYHIKKNMSESQVARIEVQGIPGVDFDLKIVNELEETILAVDETGEQESERITNLGLDVNSDYFIKLESNKKGANAKDLYSIYLQLSPYYGGEEFELNDKPEKANLIEIEHAIAGYIHPIGDVDYYRLVLQNYYSGTLEIMLKGIMKVNTDVTLYDNTLEEIGRASAKPAEGIERLTFDPVPGIYYIKVYDNDGKESNYRDKYELAIFVKP